MNKEEISALTWKDFLFSLTGSTIFIVALYFITDEISSRHITNKMYTYLN